MRREPDFEESADMRLVELERAKLGVSKPELGAWQTQSAPEGPAVDAEGEPFAQGALLAVELSATPASDVIPGAIVTLALSIANEGYEPARSVRVGVPLPGGASFRNGSLIRNGQAVLDEVAEALFGTGLDLGEVPARSRATLVWKIGVRLGNKPLVMSPTATAEDAAVVGAKTLSISRREGANTGFNLQVREAQRDLPVADLPIYELDDEETLEHEAAQAALSPVVPPPRNEYQPPMEPPTPVTPPPAQPEPYSPPPDQPSAPPPEQPPDAEPAAAVREGAVLYGRIDRPSLAYFERLFNGSKAPTLLDHSILGGALACSDAADGEDRGLDAHLQAQRQLLQRLVLHEKLGKKEPIVQYTGELLARIDAFAKHAVPARAPLDDSNAVLLECELDAPTLGVLAKMQSDTLRWDFTKARQLTLALQARKAISRAPEAANEGAEAALRAYAQVSGTQLQRFFVRMRLDRTTGLLFSHDETLDAAARRAIAALTALF